MQVEYGKPTIEVCVNPLHSDSIILKEVLYGIEEEGIPYELFNEEKDDPVAMAYLACQKSRLGVGVAVGSKEVVVHYEKLAQDTPLFRVSIDAQGNSIRSIGTNAARLVKKMPFKNIE